MTDTQPAKPQPHPTELTKPYWDGAREGRLRLQRCGRCHAPRHYPRIVCDRCASTEVEWIDASGLGRLHSWTIAHHVFHPAFAGEVPYVLGIVDLDEGPRALGLVKGIDASALRLELRVRAHFKRRADGTPELEFRPVDAP